MSGLVLAALAATTACGDGTRRSESRWRELSGSARRLEAPAWDTAWVRGGAQDDTLLLMPWALAADSARVYVLDAAGYRVAAFRAADGSLAWITGRKGSGPAEFKAPTALAAVPGGVAVADPRNERVTVLDTAGRVVRELQLRGVGDVRSLCPLRDGTLLLSTTDDSRPLTLLAPNGVVAERLELPWPDLAKVPPLARQARLAPTGGRAGCVVALELGRGFAVYEGGRFAPPRPYVESFDLPRVEVRRSFGARSQRVVERQVGAYDVTVGGGEIHFAFEGKTPSARRLVDVYDERTGAYLRTYLLATGINNIARVDRRIYLIAERDGYPELLALDVRAARASARREALRGRRRGRRGAVDHGSN